MKAVFISIQPKWCELIASRKKVIEVRKSVPKLPRPFKCYIYCTKGKPTLVSAGKVIGEFMYDYTVDLGKIYAYAHKDQDFYEILKNACLTDKDLQKYAPNGNAGAWHISDLKIYDKPKELDEFCHPCTNRPCASCKFLLNEYNKPHTCNRCITTPPQSWCYVEEL